MINDEKNPSNPLPDPYAAKANYDVNQQKLHSQGTSGLWRQISNLLIIVGIITVIIVLVKIF